MGPARILLSWSGGKDAAWALHTLREVAAAGGIVGLMSAVVPAFDRISMHGVRTPLVRAQARAADLPLLEVPLPWPCSNERYEAEFLAALAVARRRWSVTHVAFGDLFLQDVRAYRERLLAGTGVTPLFPLWGLPTDTLLHTMLDGGLRARIVCLDPARLDRSFAGRDLASAAAELPAGVDPCGERGEFHTFVTDGPMLSDSVSVELGEVVEREGFVYADLLPAAAHV